MSRKHYQALARTIYLLETTEEVKRELAECMANSMGQFNSNFKHDRFIEACMTGSN